MNKVKICIVEDERIIAHDIEFNLLASGYDVSNIVSTGEEAIRVTKASTPDVVLMDIGLEGNIDGIETADQIHSYLNIPVIFLTAYSDDITCDRAQKAKPIGFLHKPIEPAEMVQMIEKALRER